MAGGDFIEPNWPGRIVGDEGHDRIAACLVLDFQRAPAWCEQALAEIEDVLSGRQQAWDMGMNAYMVKVRRSETEILPVYEETGEPTVTVKTRDLHSALDWWRKQMMPSPD
jgi:hypothetical protein